MSKYGPNHYSNTASYLQGCIEILTEPDGPDRDYYWDDPFINDKEHLPEVLKLCQELLDLYGKTDRQLEESPVD